MYYSYGQRPSSSVDGCYMIWMIYDGHMITGDECGLCLTEKNLNQGIDPTGDRTRIRCVRSNDVKPRSQRWSSWNLICILGLVVCSLSVLCSVLSLEEALTFCWTQIQEGPSLCSCLVLWSIVSCSPSGFFNHCYLETLQHLGHIASRVFGCIPEGCVFNLLCVVNVFIC